MRRLWPGEGARREELWSLNVHFMDFRLSAEGQSAQVCTPVSIFYEDLPVFSGAAGVIMIEDGRHNGSPRRLKIYAHGFVISFMWILSCIWRLVKTRSLTPQ